MLKSLELRIHRQQFVQRGRAGARDPGYDEWLRNGYCSTIGSFPPALLRVQPRGKRAEYAADGELPADFGEPGIAVEGSEQYAQATEIVACAKIVERSRPGSHFMQFIFHRCEGWHPATRCYGRPAQGSTMTLH